MIAVTERVHLLNWAIYYRHILASTYLVYMHISSATSGPGCMYCRVGWIRGVTLSIILDRHVMELLLGAGVCLSNGTMAATYVANIAPPSLHIEQ